MIYTLIQTLKGGEKAESLGNSVPEEWQGGEFPGFSFWLIYPRLGTDKGGNLESQTDTDKKNSNKSKAPQKRQPSKT